MSLFCLLNGDPVPSGVVGVVMGGGGWNVRTPAKWPIFYFFPGGMLVHRKVTPSIKLTGTLLYTWSPFL